MPSARHPGTRTPGGAPRRGTTSSWPGVLLCAALAGLPPAGSLGGPVPAEPGPGGVRMEPVNIFGDGNPENGVEDDRLDISSPAWNEDGLSAWNTAAGTVHCDGRNRGSAVVVDTSEFGRLREGVVIATSAHVLFDLESRALFGECSFHYMALDHLPGYRASIDLGRSRRGAFDPADPRTGPMFGRGDWAFLYVPGPVPGAAAHARLRPRAWSSLRGDVDAGASFRFIAFSPARRVIVISSPCRVAESRAEDLGGGSWAGQLLDDCDSEDGASGGGLVASLGGRHYLVGIRSGAHWDGGVFPPRRYPDGPPAGAVWDRSRNTNFSRAIDGELIEGLRSLVREIARVEQRDALL